MSRFKDTDYLNISMRIKYLEARLMGSEAFGRMLSCKSPDDAIAVVCDRLGAETGKITSAFDFETLIESEEEKVSDFLLKNIPDRSLYEIFAIRRDFMNIRALVKADICNISPDRMLVSGGTLTKEEIKKAFDRRDEKLLDGYFIAAVKAAFSIYAQTGDPQRIDTVCDRICFECLKNAADRSPFDFVSDFFGMRIDLINILSFIRQKLMGKDNSFYSTTILPGGKIFSEKELTELYLCSLPEFFEHVSKTEYGVLTADIDPSNPDTTALERNADKFVCTAVKKLRKVSFGPQVIAGYILAKEYEIKNIRIAMSGILSGQSSDVIKERLRLGYE